MKFNKKGQLNLNSAPSIILIIGLTFLMMATLTFVGYEYGDAIATTKSGSAVNETTTPVRAGVLLDADALRNGACGTITAISNATGDILIDSGNYTQTGCLLQNISSDITDADAWLVNYPYTYSGLSTAVNVTQDLETEIEGNTTIAGMVLTISLVGIVLSILIGIFAGFGRRRV